MTRKEAHVLGYCILRWAGLDSKPEVKRKPWMILDMRTHQPVSVRFPTKEAALKELAGIVRHHEQPTDARKEQQQ